MKNIDLSNVALMASPWAIAPHARDAAINALLHPHAARPGPGATRGAARRPAGRTAVIPVYGILTQHRTLLESFGLGTSCDTVARQLRAALADAAVDRVILDVDSPGGSVFGVNELAAEIRSARAVKPILGVANSMAASAAYWIGSACTELYCVPSGMVGGIGVIVTHEDVSRALEIAGTCITLVTSGKFKAEGNPCLPLGAEALRAIQADVDSYGADFTTAVSKGRGVPVETVRTGMGEGRLLRGDAAMRAGMVDGVMTLDAVLAGRARPGGARIRASTLAQLPPRLASALRSLELLES